MIAKSAVPAGVRGEVGRAPQAPNISQSPAALADLVAGHALHRCGACGYLKFHVAYNPANRLWLCRLCGSAPVSWGPGRVAP